MIQPTTSAYHITWGEQRPSNHTSPIKYTYTGQYSNVTDFGLMYYNARFYDPQLGRFLSADTLIPDPGDPVSYDRYAYSRNNPVRYTDPSGHGYCDGNDAAENVDCSFTAQDILGQFYGVTLESGNLNWTDVEMLAVYMGVQAVGSRISLSIRDKRESVLSPGTAFQNVHGNITFVRGNEREDGSTRGFHPDCSNIGDGGCTSSAILINFVSMSGGALRQMDRMAHNVVHELGHAYDNQRGFGPRNDMPSWIYQNRSKILRPNEFENRYNWQQNLTVNESETFADMYIAWTYGVWNTNPRNAEMVSDAKKWLDEWMP